MRRDNLQEILKTGITLSKEQTPQHLLEQALRGAVELTDCDKGILYLKTEDSLIFRDSCRRTKDGGICCEDESDLPDISLNSEEDICVLALREKQTVSAQDSSMLAAPIVCQNGEQIGVLQLTDARDPDGSIRAFSPEAVLAADFIAAETAYIIQNIRYLDDIGDLLLSFVRVISSAIDERTPYNVSHTRHMARCGRRFIDYLNQLNRETGSGPFFTSDQKSEFSLCIWLHDIGKLVTPLEVMNKNSRLTDIQYREILHRLEIIRLLGAIERLNGRITETEEQALAGEIDRAREWIDRANTASILTDDLRRRISTLAERVYTDQNGLNRPWLTAEEAAVLSIRAGTLTPEERTVMENHVVLTDKLLSKIYFPAHLSHVHQWASMHHELLDGSGYPRGLTAESIPTEVRILTILDVFDALVAEDRPYKPGIPVKEALAILDHMAETGKLDRRLVTNFKESRCWESSL